MLKILTCKVWFPCLKRLVVVTAAVVEITLGNANLAQAVYTYWTGAAGTTDWNNSGNWSNGVPSPGGLDTAAVVGNAFVQQPIIDTPAIIGYLVRIGDAAAGGPAPLSGVLTINNGELMLSRYMAVGYSDGTDGQLIISGPGSALTVTKTNGIGNLYVGFGDNSSGNVEISDGASVFLDNLLDIAAGTGSVGLLTVDASTMSIGGNFRVGDNGNGTMTIRNGSVVRSGTSLPPVNVGSISGFLTEVDAIGLATGSVSQLIVSGTGSRLTSYNLLVVGGRNPEVIPFYANNFGLDATDLFQGHGSLLIADGGAVESGVAGNADPHFVNTSSIGGTPGSVGVVTVTDPNSSWNVGGALVVGNLGQGTLSIANSAQVSVAGGVTLAENTAPAGHAATTGVLAIGAAPGAAPAAPGIISTPNILFGPGEGRIVFNHTAPDYVFDATINGGADNAAGSGTGLVGDGLIQAIAGRTLLNADHHDFTGTLQASGAGILQVNGNMAGAAADIFTGGTLEGGGIVGPAFNAGAISPGTSIGTLTVAGNYTGGGGVLDIEAVLGDDTSPTDLLIITGDVSGNTTVQVTNLGGAGAETVNGIQIIRIGGASPDNAFVLKGDYITELNQQAVISGAFAYALQHGGTVTTDDGNWYLVCRLPVTNPDTEEIVMGPRYQPGVPLFEQYPQVLASLNTVPTLRQRVDNRFWQKNEEECVPGVSGMGGMWGRVEGSHTRSEPRRSTAYAHRETDLWKLQAGFDAALRQGSEGSLLVGGVNVSYGMALSDIGSPYGRGKIDATGVGIGTTLTWYGADGFYVDGQAQAMWFNSDITSRTIGRKEINDNSGQGLALSAETGFRYPLANGFSLTPQGQLVWSRVYFNNFKDPFKASVRLDNGDSLRGRLGLSFDYETSFTAADGTLSRSRLYTIANLYREFMNSMAVSVSNTRFTSRNERLWAGIGIGGTYEWKDGRYALYGDANLAGSTHNLSNNRSFGGAIGFRTTW